MYDKFANFYILNGKKPVPVAGETRLERLLAWAEWFENAGVERQVAETVIGKIRISTIFFGLDHSFGSVKPQLFETYIFGGNDNGVFERYATWLGAEAGHKRAVKHVEANLYQNNN